MNDFNSLVKAPYVKQVNVLRGTSLTDTQKSDAEKKIEALRKEENKLVDGIFKNLEVPGGDLTFSYRKFKGDPILTFTLKHNQRYKLPLGVARHLNSQCYYPKHKYLLGPDGQPLPETEIGMKEHRYAFQSLEFVA